MGSHDSCRVPAARIVAMVAGQVRFSCGTGADIEGECPYTPTRVVGYQEMAAFLN